MLLIFSNSLISMIFSDGKAIVGSPKQHRSHEVVPAAPIQRSELVIIEAMLSTLTKIEIFNFEK